ncbi:MAG: hypothetical protein VX986_06135 [Pseudomonadota bacterium]|nr:hypothetical protein [Pseudomonadota bacterium]
MVEKSYLRQISLFLVIGLLIYSFLYWATEILISQHGERNRFFAVKTASAPTYDYVILGASHALPLGFEGMTEQLEKLTGSKIINLSTPGGGIIPNQLLLDYFLTRHTTKNVLYVLDSFAFYSREWNEDRISDVRLFRKAPADLALANLLLSYGFNRGVNLSVAVDYILGFSKINNPHRFETDISNDELKKFDKVHRPSSRDKRRIDYLYPARIDNLVFEKYLTIFSELIDLLNSQGIALTVIKPPIPPHFYQLIPNESEFDVAITNLLARKTVSFHDFSQVNNDPNLFYDSDHLNRKGVLSLFQNYLKNVLLR